jgi:hypothetical protein
VTYIIIGGVVAISTLFFLACLVVGARTDEGPPPKGLDLDRLSSEEREKLFDPHD